MSGYPQRSRGFGIHAISFNQYKRVKIFLWQVELFQQCLTRFALERAKSKFPLFISFQNELNAVVAEVANAVEKNDQPWFGSHDA